MGCVLGAPRQQWRDYSAQTALPPYKRPTYVAALFKPASRKPLQDRLSKEETRYNDFLNDQLLVAQRAWVSNVRSRGLEVESADTLCVYPFMTISTHSAQLERIAASQESGNSKIDQLLYIYMPAKQAQECGRRQSLDYVPDYMRFLDFGGLRKIMAVSHPPYATNTNKRAMVERYHSAGCGEVDESDIAYCAVITQTSFTDYVPSMDCYKRVGYGPIDVLAVAPVLFANESPVEPSSEDSD
ncbi:RolB family protein [Bradyrhizobium sp. 142]|uniref:RolB family protein n=1 Tax=Bradyrhizobium sp. 142 TaxID=2782618 RepID=UPI001FFB30E5|nr:RolB family protein [Bradyrhizobium sp. 142]MCK1732014.1 hypothetical protein [Bradyrhizobium sp. 142]